MCPLIQPSFLCLLQWRDFLAAVPLAAACQVDRHSRSVDLEARSRPRCGTATATGIGRREERLTAPSALTYIGVDDRPKHLRRTRARSLPCRVPDFPTENLPQFVLAWGPVDPGSTSHRGFRGSLGH